MNLINIDAEVGADIIGDDAQPTLTLKNTSTGPGLWAQGLAVTSTASIDLLKAPVVTTGGGSILAANASIGQQLVLSHVSRASGAYVRIAGGLASCATILAITGGVAGTYALRVVVPSGVFGWIPIYPDGAVTAAAVE